MPIFDELMHHIMTWGIPLTVAYIYDDKSMIKFYYFMMVVSMPTTLFGFMALYCCSSNNKCKVNSEPAEGDKTCWHYCCEFCCSSLLREMARMFRILFLFSCTAIISFPIVIFWFNRIRFSEDNFNGLRIIFLWLLSLNLFFLCLFYSISFLLIFCTRYIIEREMFFKVLKVLKSLVIISFLPPVLIQVIWIMIEKPINSYFVTTWFFFMGIFTSQFTKYFTKPDIIEEAAFLGYFALLCTVILQEVFEKEEEQNNNANNNTNSNANSYTNLLQE
jgi:hypothetical protein